MKLNIPEHEYIFFLDQKYMIKDRRYMVMRTLKECIHCGREYESMKNDFCSYECAIEASK